VKISEANASGKMKIQCFFDYMLDAAASHSTEVGMNAVDLLGQGMTWVVSRYHLHIDKYPLWNQKFNVLTWRAGEINNYAIREFLFSNDNNEIIARSSSTWLLLDLKNGSILDPRAVFEDYPWKDDRAIKVDFEKFDVLKIAVFSNDFQIRLQDIDLNNHVNNSIYPSIAYETGFDFYKGKCTLEKINVFFKEEALYGNTIQSEIEETEHGNLIHRLVGKDSGKVHALLKSTWSIFE
jgi:medium-chain acyl-[acyl-carrier-protein] hydrolase